MSYFSLPPVIGSLLYKAPLTVVFKGMYGLPMRLLQLGDLLIAMDTLTPLTQRKILLFLNARKTHLSSTHPNSFCAFRVGRAFACARSIIGVSHGVADARKLSVSRGFYH